MALLPFLSLRELSELSDCLSGLSVRESTRDVGPSKDHETRGHAAVSRGRW